MHRSVAARAAAHEQFMTDVLRDLAGEQSQMEAEASVWQMAHARNALLASRKKGYQRNRAPPRSPDRGRGRALDRRRPASDHTLAPDAWITVSRPALRHNVAAMRALLAQGTDEPPQMIAVVKANAFGHGAGETACIMQDAGVDFFAVTTPAEGLELRAAGITGRILVFLPPLPDQSDAAGGD